MKFRPMIDSFPIGPQSPCLLILTPFLVSFNIVPRLVAHPEAYSKRITEVTLEKQCSRQLQTLNLL